MTNLLLLTAYLAPLALLVTVYILRWQRREARASAALQQSVKSGLTDPPSLHPVIDPDKCIGAGGCTRACPEGALGIIKGKAQLVNPTVCIGHGACAAACPSQAITFGDLKDPKSKVAQLVANRRAYKVLEELGAKPAITYLADLKNPVEGGHHAN